MDQKSFEEIVYSMINNIHDKIPYADTKEGTFVRDVFIDPAANQIANMYGDLKLLELSQSVLTAVGDDLDKLAGNYFVTRKSATKSYGTVRFFIDEQNFPDFITIPAGSILTSLATTEKKAVRVKTIESIVIDKDVLDNLPVAINGYKYIDINASSIESGEFTNVDSGQLVIIESCTAQNIYGVTNPFAFSGGTDKESDNSLVLRIKLAISGANIGTKNGYLGFVLKQNGVIDAKVVGAGDKMMIRDDGYGGKVDIYIRGRLSEETTQQFNIDQTYINNEYPNIIFNKQPVNSIVSIVANDGTTFLNADNFECTKETTIQSNGETKVNPTYYKDYEWDFSLTDSFPKTDINYIPSSLTDFQIIELKSKVDVFLHDALNYMTNTNPDLNWNVMTKITENEYFYLWGTNGKIYKLIGKHAWINGISFVKKNNKIYLRERVEPDFALVVDDDLESGSTRAKDSILWLPNGNKPLVGQSLTIKYNYDSLIDSLQNGIEKYRVLTADVLLRRTTPIEVQISLGIQVYKDYSLEDTKSEVINKISIYINNLKTLGAEFDRSDIVSVAKEIKGVDRVDLNTVTIRKIGGNESEIISINDNEYFVINNIDINASYSSSNS